MCDSSWLYAFNQTRCHFIDIIPPSVCVMLMALYTQPDQMSLHIYIIPPSVYVIAHGFIHSTRPDVTSYIYHSTKCLCDSSWLYTLNQARCHFIYIYHSTKCLCDSSWLYTLNQTRCHFIYIIPPSVCVIAHGYIHSTRPDVTSYISFHQVFA